MFSEPHIPPNPNEWEPTDCGDDGCGECEVCEYLSFIEWANSVRPESSMIQRDERMEAYLKWRYPKSC